MKQLKRTLFIPLAILLGILLLLYATIYFVGKHYLSDSAVRELIAKRAKSTINRDVTIGDKIEYNVGWNFTPHVEISNVTMSNFAGSKQPIMLSVENLKLSVDLLELLEQKIRITKLTLTKPIIHLETLNGKDNWDFDDAATPKTKQELNSDDNSEKIESSHRVSANIIKIIDGQITYTKDHQLQESLDVKTLNLKANDSNTHFSGNLDAMRQKAHLVFAGDVTLDDDEYKFDLDKVIYGSTDVTGTIKIDRKSKKITGDLKSKSVNLTEFSSNSSTNSASGEYSIPNTAIPVDFLRGSNVSFTYKIQKLTLQNMVLNKVTFKASSKNDVINCTFDPKLQIAGGTLDIDLKYDLNPKTPRLNFVFAAKSINFATLLTQLSGSSPLTGSTLDITSNLQSTGSTYAALVNNLSGKILMTASAGQYVNGSSSIPGLVANVLSGIITFKKTESQTSFTCGVMNFKVNNGQAIANRGVAIEAASVNVLGNGSVNLRNGRINFAMVPKNISLTNTMDLSQFSMAQAVTISGTMSKPVVSFNPVNLLSASNIASAAGLAAKIAAWPIGVASVAKDVVDSSTNSNQGPSPCAIARSN